jgi:hypothetical protein
LGLTYHYPGCIFHLTHEDSYVSRFNLCAIQFNLPNEIYIQDNDMYVLNKHLKTHLRISCELKPIKSFETHLMSYGIDIRKEKTDYLKKSTVQEYRNYNNKLFSKKSTSRKYGRYNNKLKNEKLLNIITNLSK